MQTSTTQKKESQASNIQVMVRVRPFTDQEQALRKISCIQCLSPHQILIKSRSE